MSHSRLNTLNHPLSREHHTCGALAGGSKILAAGGMDTASGDTAEIFDVASGTWSDAPSLPHRLALSSGLTIGPYVYLVGGNDQGTALDTIYTFDGSEWGKTD